MQRLLVILAAGLLAGAAAAAEPDRVLGLAGAPNFRDLGGYETVDGHHVRYGLIYRSEKLSALTPADDLRLDRLHIAAEVDLRTAEERRSEPSRWLHPPGDLYESPKETLGPDIKSLLAGVHDAASARTAVDGFYARMPDLYREEYAALFRRLASGEHPIVVHCTAGKDRTGVASAIVLSALGVPRSTVVADYALTNRLLPVPTRQSTAGAAKSISAMDQLPDDARDELWRAEDEYVLAALGAIDREYGSVGSYLEKGLGLTAADLAALKASLLE